MNISLDDRTFSFELLRAASYATYGGADLGECLATATRIREGDFESWYVEWRRMAERVEAIAEQALRYEAMISAREFLLRASNYYRTAEFFLDPDDPRRLVTYQQSRACFRKAVALLSPPVEAVEIPYEGTTLPGYWYRVDDLGVARPTILALGGFDSTGEDLYFRAAAAALRRGYNCLTFDGPGQGAALRLQGLPARPDYEVPVRAAVDHLLDRPEIDPERLAIWGTSMGAYHALRAAAFEPRVKACVVHGVLFDLWDARAAHKPLLFKLARYWPGLFDIEPLFHLAARRDPGLRWSAANGRWVFGGRTRRELLRAIRPYSLKDIAGRVACPVLMLHGEHDQLIPIDQVHTLYNALPGPKTLHVFSADDGAEEHCQMGNLSLLHHVAFAWLDRVVGSEARTVPLPDMVPTVLEKRGGRVDDAEQA